MEQFAGFLIFQLVQAAFAATVAQRFPFRLSQVGKSLGFPETPAPSAAPLRGRGGEWQFPANIPDGVQVVM
ncbi:MAG: hypothetical protein NHG36_08460 [Chromatiaceae bacterium]|nr:hypothetical protein [Candidatus Thioaporhodococcus sediminis]